MGVQTEPMRKAGGFAVIIEALEKLRGRHAEHIAAYGTHTQDTHRRRFQSWRPARSFQRWS